MNKKLKNSLSGPDKEKLAVISSGFELAEQILGPEPGIYYVFDVPLPPLPPEMASIINQRQDLFSKIASAKSKEV